MLTQAHVEPRYRNIKDHTIGSVFFGTPHRGSVKASYGSILANVATSLTRKPSSKLMNALRANSSELERITSDFKFQVPEYQFVSFYELKSMSVFSSLVSTQDR